MGPIEQYVSHQDWPFSVGYIGTGASVHNAVTGERGEVVELAAYGSKERNDQLDVLWADARKRNLEYHRAREASTEPPPEVHIPLGRSTLPGVKLVNAIPGA